MDITQEKIDDLNAVLKVKLQPEDYEQKVEQVLKDYRKQVNLPGFRAGKVPFGIVKKRFGLAVLQEEVSKIVGESVQSYLVDNKLQVVGQPLPKVQDETPIDWNNQKEFEFLYELGLAPNIDLQILEKKGSVTEYSINVDQKIIDEELESLKSYYATNEDAEKVCEKDIIEAAIVEIDNDGNDIDDGINKTINFSLVAFEDESSKASLLGLGKEQSVDCDFNKAFKNNYDKIGSVLHISADEAKELKNNFRLTVKGIKTRILPELNQELFERIYGKDAVKDETEFLDKFKSDIAEKYKSYTTRKLENELMDQVIEKFDLKLPDEFLRRWLKVINEDQSKRDKIDEEYDSWSSSMKWQLIQRKIVEENNLQATEEELRDHVKITLQQRLQTTGQSFEEEQLKMYCDEYLKDNKHKEEVENQVVGDKIVNFFKPKFNITVKEVSMEDFLKL
ncbi:MAG: trigger factor [Bacteroidia bacterium]|nr:trigger factor [Bacteroidia bacterium]